MHIGSLPEMPPSAAVPCAAPAGKAPVEAPDSIMLCGACCVLGSSLGAHKADGRSGSEPCADEAIGGRGVGVCALLPQEPLGRKWRGMGMPTAIPSALGRGTE